jgi:hypothetical protein
MADLETLEAEVLAAIATAADEQAVEAVRVSALGKKGSISALLATLGKMAPDERKVQGAAINALKDKVSEALAARKAILKEAALEARLLSETLDVTLPVQPSPLEAGRIHPITQVMDELAVIFTDMGFSIAEGPDVESELSAGSSGAPDARYVFPDAGCAGRTQGAAHPYEPGAGAHDAEGKAADPRDLPWPHLSLRFRSDAYADVPSGRGARYRQGGEPRPSQMGA